VVTVAVVPERVMLETDFVAYPSTKHAVRRSISLLTSPVSTGAPPSALEKAKISSATAYRLTA
jgi:hypothetical protein